MYGCAFEGASFTCLSGTTGKQSWEYGSAADFIREAQIPNRLFVRSRSVSSGGPMLITTGGSYTEYRYDGSGRLIGRRRTGWAGYSPQRRELDVVEYTSWDALGRPTSGVIHAGGRSEDITIHYNDAARHMEASNGEAVTRDVNGNVVTEVEIVGFAHPLVHESVIQSTAQVCL